MEELEAEAMIKRQYESRRGRWWGRGAGKQTHKLSKVLMNFDIPESCLTCCHLPEKLFSPRNPGLLQPSVELCCALC